MAAQLCFRFFGQQIVHIVATVFGTALDKTKPPSRDKKEDENGKEDEIRKRFHCTMEFRIREYRNRKTGIIGE